MGRGSWRLSLFVLFELRVGGWFWKACSWGLSLFVLFERWVLFRMQERRSWGLSLFVLFEQMQGFCLHFVVLED